jgi:putative aminopeptidase FrvX
MDYALLRQLVATPGVSGREEQVRALVSEKLSPLTPNITTDAMGSLIAHIPGSGPRMALIAHMDEIGFLVSKIDPQGFVRVMPVGGVDARVFGAQKVMVHGRRDIPGIVGSIPPHLQKKNNGPESKNALPIEESFIDLGLPAEQVQQLVKVGDPVTFGTIGWENEHAFFAKALDDRVGLFIMLSAAQQVKKLDCDLFLIASTQEEYGLRGAGPAVFSIQAQIALALEGTVASDTPGLKLPPNMQPTVQGKGPEIRISDQRMISDRQLVDFLIATAEAADIPHQVIVKNTGATDAAISQTTAHGVKVCALSVPARYIHSPMSFVRKADVKSTIDLVTAVLENCSKLSL